MFIVILMHKKEKWERIIAERPTIEEADDLAVRMWSKFRKKENYRIVVHGAVDGFDSDKLC